VTGRHVGQNRLKTVSGRSHAWFRKFGAQTFLVFESREETQIRPIVQGGKKDFFLYQSCVGPKLTTRPVLLRSVTWPRARWQKHRSAQLFGVAEQA